VLDALHGHFKPEFLNRVDDIIIFHPLGKEQLVKIVELRLEDLRRLLADRKISLELTDAAKELLFTEGYDPNFGARPLKRAIQKLVQDPLALKILDGEVLHGDHVVVDADKKAGKMTFKVSERVGGNQQRGVPDDVIEFHQTPGDCASCDGRDQEHVRARKFQSE
jgi:ATP-dependent Clp protease ATP-binding subunit ClpB